MRDSSGHRGRVLQPRRSDLADLCTYYVYFLANHLQHSRELKKALDTVESFDLGVAGKTYDNLGNFVLHDADATSDE